MHCIWRGTILLQSHLVTYWHFWLIWINQFLQRRQKFSHHKGPKNLTFKLIIKITTWLTCRYSLSKGWVRWDQTERTYAQDKDFIQKYAMSLTSDLETSFKLTDTFYSYKHLLYGWERAKHCGPKWKELNTFKSWIMFKMDAQSFNALS